MDKVLIIDDETQLRGLLARIIGLEGYDVAQAGDCASGLKALERSTPDAVLCDLCPYGLQLRSVRNELNPFAEKTDQG